MTGLFLIAQFLGHNALCYTGTDFNVRRESIMAKRKVTKRSRSFSEKVMIVLSIIIALSMILGLVVGLSGNRNRSSSTQTSQLLPDGPTLTSRVATHLVHPTAVTMLVEDLAPPGVMA